MINNYIKRLRHHFLSPYTGHSYVIRQKAYILLLMLLVVIPIMILVSVVNLTTSASTHPLLISLVNLCFAIALIKALHSLRKGEYRHAANIAIFATALRVIAGSIIKLPILASTGSDNNIYFIFCSIAVASLFGSRRMLFLITLLFITLNLSFLYVVRSHYNTAHYYYIIGSTINIAISLVIVFSLLYMINTITNRSLKVAEEELEKNRELSRSLENNILELKGTHQDLLEANENLIIFKNFAEASGQGLGIANLNGFIIYANSALSRIMGFYRQDEAPGKNLFHFYPDELNQWIKEGIIPMVMNTGQWVGELPLRSLAGDITPAIQNIFLIRDNVLKPAHFAIVLTDITERKKLEEQLAQAQRMEAIGRLAGGIAHDFNNILTAISGFSELLQNQMPPDDPRRVYVDEIKKAVRRSASLTSQLLAFSRKQVLKPMVMDLNSEVEDMNKMLRRLIGEDIILSTQLEPDLNPVFADPGQIEQVLMNLVINARDAMPNGGTLTIRTGIETIDEYRSPVLPGSQTGNFVFISIKDTGTGIDGENIGHIFEPFFSTKEINKGTGLGLSVVYGIIEQHNGWIQVESLPGDGSHFKIYLPIYQKGHQTSGPTE